MKFVPHASNCHLAKFDEFWTMGRPSFGISKLEDLKIEGKN
jgi:hypothetical protein